MEIPSRLKLVQFYKYTLLSLVMLCIGCLLAYQIVGIRSFKKPVPAFINTRTLVDPSLPRTLLKKYQTNGDFQSVSNNNHTYVYSAYLEERQDKIRVVGITLNTTSSLYCILWYSAAFIICYLKGNEVPNAVSIIENTVVTEPENLIQVVRPPDKSIIKQNFTVCLSPIHNGYKNTDELIEWLEILQLQGVSRVVAYLHDASRDVISVLNFYRARGLVTILPWTLPRKMCSQPMKNLHYCGQLGAINDCVYRNKGHSHFVASFDIDELIIPQRPEDYTWMDMFKRLPNNTFYKLRNTFFFPSQHTTRSTETMETNLRISSNLFRDDFIYGPGARSKWIVQTDGAVIMGIHRAWALTNDHVYTVPTNIGLLHHYRKDEVKYPEGVNPLAIIKSRNLMYKYFNTTNDFQVSSNLNGTYLYSAYLDEKARIIRIISVSDNAGPLYCLFWYKNGNNMYHTNPVSGCFVKHADHHNRQFAATFVLCYLQDNTIPDTVSVVQNPNIEEPTNLLPVQILKSSESKQNFTVCLSPLQQNYSNVKELVEWLEIIQLQGVTRVVVYVHNATNDVISVLKFYRSRGLVKILPWTLPASFCDDNIRDSHYCGQIAALNDCVYRNKGLSHFVASLDLDEVIVPQYESDITWGDMLKRVPNASSYIIRTTFFKPTEFNKVTKHNNWSSTMISSSLRDEFIFDARNRSKLIVRPEMIVGAGIHHQWALSSLADEVELPTNICLLHHYRKISIYETGFQRMRKKHYAAFKYINKLKSRLQNIYTNLATMNLTLDAK
ncbi:hypothetical protein ACF0H5_011802 [Mactra antiquata]